MISTVSWLLYLWRIMQMYLQKGVSIKTFCWLLEGNWRKEQDPEPDPDPSVKGTNPRIQIRIRIRTGSLPSSILFRVVFSFEGSRTLCQRSTRRKLGSILCNLCKTELVKLLRITGTEGKESMALWPLTAGPNPSSRGLKSEANNTGPMRTPNSENQKPSRGHMNERPKWAENLPWGRKPVPRRKDADNWG